MVKKNEKLSLGESKKCEIFLFFFSKTKKNSHFCVDIWRFPLRYSTPLGNFGVSLLKILPETESLANKADV